VRLALLREQPKPVAHDDRIDPEVELVDEVALEQPAEELAAAVDLELAPGLRLELAHRGLKVAGDDVSVLPGRVLERGRGHVFWQHVDAVGDRIAAVVKGPIWLPDLPGLASEQQRVRALEPRGQERPHFLVGMRRRPSAALEPTAPVLVRPAGPLVHAVDGQHHRCGQLHGHRSFSCEGEG